MRIGFIFLIIIILITGCITSGSVKQVLIPLNNKIYLEEHDLNSRSYHMKMGSNFPLQLIITQIYEINGVQSAQIIPYQIIVRKSPLFKWNIIELEILRILKHF